MKKSIGAVLGIFLLTPFLTLAQPLTDINSISTKATSIGSTVIGLAIAFSVVWIIINVVRYLIASNDPAKRTEGGWGILYGVIGLFVILSIWGLVNILRTSFQTNAGNVPNDVRDASNLPDVRRVTN